MPDNRPLFSAPSIPGRADAPSTRASAGDRATDHRTAARRTTDLGMSLDLRPREEPQRRANPGDELTVDPADRRRRARAALLDLRRDVIRRSATGW
ncbi:MULTISPECIES: hypothetical protein [Cellulosimicrobium]|uniref:hypothetical protein n=1 Tax=Cellulosimicrobium TaxID=157920 RepID=UPI0020979854|nr:hypothetical protein [Cellulosimicrobium cellulans]MCO7273544.1 hypothetical protein [Cellulosimicrobium cellulans]